MFNLIRLLFLCIFMQSVVICQHQIQRIELIGEYNKMISRELNSSVEYIVRYVGNQDLYPVKVIVSSQSATTELPVLVVAEQKKRITSWQLPYVVNPLKGGMEYTISGHILCPGSIALLRNTSMVNISRRMLISSDLNVVSNPVVTLKSPAPGSRSFNLIAERQTDFFLRNGVNVNVTVTGSMPIYYYYNFHDLGNEANSSGAVLVNVRSTSAICMLVSIQNSTCPVFDLENNVKFDSYWQTMNFQAGIVVTKRHYPNGFYVVLVVKEDDVECGRLESEFSGERRKPVQLQILNTVTIKDHINVAVSTISIFASIFVVCTLVGLLYLIKSIQKEGREVSGSDVVDGRNGRWRQLFTASSRSQTSIHYVWHVTIVALFYTFPVLQLVFTYQGIVHETGNEDLCYYNFLCSHPLGIINDFNHVFSNIGYVFLGLLFIIITYVKELMERSTQNELYGLAKPYGMFYALGLALIMEGILSACYHICPKSSNFQFDTSFMYVMTVLMIVNVYENRHETGDRRGYAVFGILAGATTLSVIALSLGQKLYFWILVALLQIIVCLVLTWVLDKSLFALLLNAEDRKKIETVHVCRMVLWIIGNVLNWLVAGYGVYNRNDFGSYLLMVLILNGLFYTVFYIAMKICYKERILWVTWVCLALATVVWAAAMFFFVSAVTSWEKTPAESRNLNRECQLVRYYDSHDIWHFLSSIALFFTFLVLLTLDEGLKAVPRDDIVDFHSH